MIRSVRHTAYLSVVAALSRAPSFLIPLMVAAVFGANAQTDAYFLAYSAVLLVGATVAQGIEQAIVPFAAVELGTRGREAKGYLDRAATRSAMVVLGLWAVSLPLVLAAAPAGLRALTVRYAVAFTLQTVAWCATAVYTGGLIARHRIAQATGSMLLRGAGAAVGFALVGLGAGLWVVAIGLGVGEVARLVWARSVVMRDVGPVSGADAATPAGLGRAATAQVIASAAIGAAPLVERLFAARLGPGAVSHVEYALRLLVIPSLVFEGALVPLTLSHWSREARERTGPTARGVRTAVLEGLGLAIVIAAVLALGATWFVRITLGHGHFGKEDVDIVGSLLRILAVAYVANMCAQLLERYYIATLRNRALAVLSVFRASVRVTVMWSLLGVIGLRAFPVGFAASDWLYCGALAVLMVWWYRPMNASPSTVT